MGWRVVVIRNRAKLDLKLNNMVVRGTDTKKVCLNEISTLVIESTSVSVTTALLAELVRQKIKVIFCDQVHNPSSELLPYYGSHDSSDKLKEQIDWRSNIKGEVWTEVVISKIKEQAKMLEYAGYDASLLHLYANQIEYRDSTNREGHAAKVYFNLLFGKGYSRSQDIPLNSALNYGYAILLSLCNREIVANGYVTQLGLFHDNIFNKFNLGSDFMEPFRPAVDKIAYDMLANDELLEFSTTEKTKMLNVLNSKVEYDGKKYFLDFAAKKYCKSALDALSCNDISKLKFCKLDTKV
jgi:CRISPR-associated endonuclease Cas1 subtype II